MITNAQSVSKYLPCFAAVLYNASLDVFCAGFVCPGGYPLVPDADSNLCADTGCTEDFCCEIDCETPMPFESGDA